MESEQDNGTNIQNTDVQGKSATEMTQNQGADTGAEEKSAERTPKKAEDTPDNKIDSPVTPANKNADTDAEEISIERTPNQANDITDNKMKSSVATAKEHEVAKGEPTELPPNLGDRTSDNKLTAGAATNEDEDTITERKSAERTSKQAEDTHENNMESSVTPAKVDADTDANGKPTGTGPGAEEDTTDETQTQGERLDSSETPAKQEDGTPDNKLIADAASNEEDDTTDNKLIAEAASNEDKDAIAEGISAERTSKQARDTDAKGKPTKLTSSQGDGTPEKTLTVGAAANKDTGPGAEEDTTDGTQTHGAKTDANDKCADRTQKESEDSPENKKDSPVTAENKDADTGANEDSTDGTQTQREETDANDKCADRTQKESRNEKGGEPTEPTSSKEVNSSKYLGAIPQAEDKNHDSNQIIQSVIDTNEGLLNKIKQLKQEIKDIAKDRDGKQTGMAELVQKDIRNQTMIAELRDELKTLKIKMIAELRDELETLKIKSKEEIKRKNAKINEIEKENNNFRKKDAANEKNKKEIKQQEDQIKKQKEEIRKMNVTINQLGAQRQKYENEITSLNKNIAKLNAQIRDIENKHKTEVSYLNRDIDNERQNLFSLSSQYNDLIKRLETSQREVRSLSEEKKELLLRLSKVAGANLTYNNPNIADLSDDKRPTKLAEEFSELYDNEWTDVFEELDFKTENGKTNFMLDILMKTNAICNDLSNGHTRRIKDAFCRLTTTSLNMERSGVEKKEVLVTDFQKEEKVASRDKDVVNEENTGKNETHDDDEQLDPRGEADFKHQFEHESKEAAEAQHDGTDKGAEEMIVGKAEQPMDESTGGQLNADNKENKAKNDKKNEVAEVQHDGTDKGAEEMIVGKAEQPMEQDTTDSTTVTESRGTNGTSKKNDLKQAAEAQHDGTGKGAEEMIVGKAEPSKDMVKEGNTGKNETHDDDEQRDTKSTVDFKNKFEHETTEILEQDTTDSATVTKPREKNVKSNENDLKQTADAQHDGTDKGDEEMIVGNAESSKNESAAGHLNTLNAVKKENNAEKDNNVEDQKNTTNKEENYDLNQQKKSELEHDNTDKKPIENEEENKAETSKSPKTGEDLSNKSMENEENDRIPKTQDDANENAKELQSNKTSEQQHDNTDKPPEENQVETPGSPINDKTDSDALEAPEATHSSMDDVTETTTAIRIESDFELLQKEQKKTIMDAKNFFENQLAKEVETTVADIIGKAFHTDSEKTTLKTYIQKCVNICWSMYRHNPPVFIEFPELKESTPFDTNKYKPYTSSGKFIDYIVWPALYLHEDGPLLCKGVAQGLGNKKSK